MGVMHSASPHAPSLVDPFDAKPALTQVAALEAALEAVMAGLEEASAASQAQMDAAVDAHRVVQTVTTEGL